jgi:hypothetical protein
MKYFTAVNKNGEVLGVWCCKENYAFKIGVPYPDKSENSHFYIKDGQTLHDAMSCKLVAWFKHGKPCQIKEMKLKPGQYYKRMARPNNQHPTESKGASLPNVIEFEQQIAISKGQLVSLLNRLEDIFQTVHPCEETFSTFGHEIRNLLILACTEVEAQWKGILDTHNYESKSNHSTKDYIKLNSALKLCDYSVTLPFYPWLSKVSPFKEWNIDKPTKSLDWYDSYNKIKHDREEYFDEAKLIYAINAVCACYILLFAQYGIDIRYQRHEIPIYFNIVDYPIWDFTEVYTFPYKHDHIEFEYDPITYSFDNL